MKVLGLSELIRDLNAIDRDLAADLRTRLRAVGELVARDVRQRVGRFSPPSPRTGAGVKVRVRSAGLVTVEQTKRKTTGKRPDWGVTQMKDAFLPAADANEETVVRGVDAAIERVARSHGF